MQFSLRLLSNMYTQILFAVVGVLLYVLYRQRKRHFRFFKNLGVPGPEPSILFGNFLEIFRKSTLECHKQWVKKYGRILGYFYGTKPILLVTDLELLKNVLIKDFQKFQDRAFIFREALIAVNSGDRISLHLLNIKGKAWKDVRSLVTPSFTTRKLKLMSPIVNDCIDILLENIEEKRLSGETFDLYELYKPSTIDIILRSAFGIQTNVQKNPDDRFIKLTMLLLGSPFRFFYMMMTNSFAITTPLFRFIHKFWGAARNKGYNPVEEILDRCEAIVKERVSDPSLRRTDLLQMMIDAEAKDEENDGPLTAGEEDEKKITDSSKSKTNRRLTIDQIVANSFIVLLAGFDTTSTALTFISLMLVNYPDVQERIRAEINGFLEREGKLDFGSINKLEYLDQVVREILRLYPPAYQFTNREAREDAVYDNIRIPKGTIVQPPIFVLHRDPELWPEPEEFKPERFAPENCKKRNPLAWQPFGAGPRNCIGLRLALMIIKFAIANILQKYRLLPTENTQKHPFDLTISPAFIRPKGGAPIRVEKV